MKTKQKIFILLVILLASLGYFYSRGFLFEKKVAKADGAVENLDELTARKSRLGSASWGPALLEDSANNYTWQSETLQYDDAVTGNEVWKFTNTPDSMGGETQDISITHWSADGNRVLFHSSRNNKAFNIRGYVNDSGISYVAIAAGTASAENKPPNALYWRQTPYDSSYAVWTVGQYYDPPVKIWMLSNTDGSRLKPAKNAAAQAASSDAYVLWSPVLSDILYQGSSNDAQGLSPNALYRVVMSDTTISRSSFITLPGSVTRTQLKKSISGDGSKVVVQDVNNGTWYVVTVFPEASKNLDTPSGYSHQFNFDYYWGVAPSPSWAGYHDRFLTGSANGIDGIWNYIMPESADGSWWRARATGSGTGGAPLHVSDQTVPYSWGGEIEPVNGVGGLKRDPWCPQGTVLGTECVEYLSHFTPDRWGHFGISTKSGNFPYGTSIYNLRDHKYEIKAFTGVTSPFWSQHHDWEAWSDWSVSSGGGDILPYDYLLDRVVAQNYKNIASQKNLAFTHTRYNDGGITGPYESLSRPTQSPDGTKAMFNSTFLNVTNKDIQLFWTVAYYPYPAEIKSATKNGSNVQLNWDFNQGENCSDDSQAVLRTGPTPNFTTPRTYATRGWPHETLDCPPSPREIKEFRVWQSSDNSTWTPLNTTVPYNNCSGTNECGMWSENSWNYNATQPNNSTRYYAITSVEHSGLESKTLSNVWKVVTDGTGNITTQIEQSAYTSDPGGKSNFFTTVPDAPTSINSTYDSVNKIYNLTWSAPANKSFIRYYNIYAQDGSTPTAIQQRRIASIPATSDYAGTGNFSYKDWLGNTTDGSTQYKITSVDFQGNESGVVDAIAPAAPSGLSVL